jgi:hypothetical protein
MDNKFLCKNGNLIVNGRKINVNCNIDNKPCAFIRWCQNDMCIKMIDRYLNCKNINK